MNNMSSLQISKKESSMCLSQQTSTILDIIRVCSAQMVLIGHGLSMCKLTFLRNQSSFPYIQNIGVVFLLLLSGYLMGYKIKATYVSGGLYVQNNSETFQKFMLNKAARIYVGLIPALIFVWVVDNLTVCYAAERYAFYSGFTVRNFLASLTMVQKMPVFGEILYFGSAAQIWTLSIEWWLFALCGYVAFYLVPLKNAGGVCVKHLALLLLLSYPVVHYFYSGNVSVAPMIWIIGLAIYFLQEKLNCKVDKIRYKLLVILSFLILLQIGIWKKNAYCMEFILSASLLFLLVTTVPENSKSLHKYSKFFKLTASTTYFLYLFHYSIMEFFMRVYPQMDVVKKFVLMILFSEIIAIVLTYFLGNSHKMLSNRLISIMQTKKNAVCTWGFVCILFLGSLMVNSEILNKKMEYGFHGQGTQVSPYVIENVEDFVKFRDFVNAGESFSETYFHQREDLDLSVIENWDPIGLYGSGNYFAGYYNGGGHVIYNLNCSADDGANGLFGMLMGEVRNLGIESGLIKGKYVGSIASHGGGNAAIINCYNKADLYGTMRAGGIADNFSGKISFCINLGNVICEKSDNANGLVSYDCDSIAYSYSTVYPIVSTELSGDLIECDAVSLNDLDGRFQDKRAQLLRYWSDNFEDMGNIADMCFLNGSISMQTSRFDLPIDTMNVLWLLSAVVCIAILICDGKQYGKFWKKYE